MTNGIIQQSFKPIIEYWQKQIDSETNYPENKSAYITIRNNYIRQQQELIEKIKEEIFENEYKSITDIHELDYYEIQTKALWTKLIGDNQE